MKSKSVYAFTKNNNVGIFLESSQKVERETSVAKLKKNKQKLVPHSAHAVKSSLIVELTLKFDIITDRSLYN